ncbi:MAG: DUF3365 domain-containing protein [Cognatishimia sp.]|uniref:c-type heme family protein n=1 Tax=Cognatishimia sp. TaxID=2211648 RepID=UPI003B8B7416
MSITKISLSGMFLVGAVYLGVSAPSKLPDQQASADGACSYAAQHLFEGVNAINDVARTLYTKNIVGGGLKAGLKFGEDWEQPEVEKGPLPALFLRLTAARLERMPPQLGLYLGSDEPINKSNLFSGKQAEAFKKVKETREPVFLTDANENAVAMYPDIASVQPCVSCHNNHADSPKKDWNIDDMMGATTWTFPSETLSADTLIVTTEAMLAAVAEAYQIYLDKTAGFSDPPAIGSAWPKEGRRMLPSAEIFMQRVRQDVALQVVDAMALGLARKINGGTTPCVL